MTTPSSKTSVLRVDASTAGRGDNANDRRKSRGRAPEAGFAVLVPEFFVTDLEVSLGFWCDILGFEVAYDRPASRFAFLVRGPVQVMLCQRDGTWETGELETPFGRGINVQITVDSIEPLLAALRNAGWPLYEPAKDVWYRVGSQEKGQREFLVQDPDGYLLRLVEDLGRRPAMDAPG